MDWLYEYIDRKNIHSLHGSIDYFRQLVCQEIEESKDPFDLMDLSSYLILMTGKVKVSGIKKGWILQVHGCSDSTDIYHSDWVVSVVKNMDKNYPSRFEEGECMVVDSMSNYRQRGFPIIDRMSFERSSFLILNTTQRLIRLQHYLSILYLPQRCLNGLFSWKSILGIKMGEKSFKKNRHRRCKKKGKTMMVQNVINRLMLSFSKYNVNYKETLIALQQDILTHMHSMGHAYNQVMKYRDHLISTSQITCTEKNEEYLKEVDAKLFLYADRYIPEKPPSPYMTVDPFQEPIQYF